MVDKRNVALWVVQALVAAAFLFAGGFKLFAYETAAAQPGWIRDVPEALVRTIGALEIVGAIGVVLPRATGIMPWLTPVAGAALGLVMVLAIGFHISRGEASLTPFNFVLLALAATVAIGRGMEFRRGAANVSAAAS